MPPPAPLLRRRWIRGVGEALLVLVVLFSVRACTLRGVARGAAPPLAGLAVDGGRLSLDRFADRPVAVHFWATWCEVCSVESGSIESLARTGALITVATSSGDAAAVRAHMARAGLTFPVVLDPDGSIAAAWGVTRFPTTFFLDRSHTVKTVESGYTTWLGLRARLALAGFSP